MVNLLHKAKQQQYLVSAIYGTKWSPVRETYRVSGVDDVAKKINELKARPEVLQIRIEKGGLLPYLRGFTAMGEIETVKAVRSDIPNKTEVVVLDKPKGFFGIPKVRRIIT